MKKDITIAAQPRDTRGKNAARRLRASGLTPAVMYGANQEAVAVAVSPKEIGKILREGQNTIFTVTLNGGEGTPAMVVDWQSDPVRENILHVDLKRIDLTQKITVKVPVHFTGEPQGVKLQGGLFEVISRDVEVECLPTDIPEGFELNVSELVIGQNLRASDVPLSGSVKLVSSPEQVLAHVVGARAEETTATPEGAAAPAATAEPEVIKKGKKEEAAAPEEKGKKKEK